jgi:hypothetical protein
MTVETVELIDNFNQPMSWKQGSELVVFEKEGNPEDGYCLLGFDEVGEFDHEFKTPQYAWIS